jgi:hypothetical protein
MWQITDGCLPLKPITPLKREFFRLPPTDCQWGEQTGIHWHSSIGNIKSRVRFAHALRGKFTFPYTRASSSRTTVFLQLGQLSIKAYSDFCFLRNLRSSFHFFDFFLKLDREIIENGRNKCTWQNSRLNIGIFVFSREYLLGVCYQLTVASHHPI